VEHGNELKLTNDPVEAPAMRLPRVRLTVWRLMVGVALLAPVFLLLRVNWFLAIMVSGSLCGAMSQATRGARAIVGGALGGVASCWLVLVLVYARAYLYPDPLMVDYLGPFLALAITGVYSSIYGAGVGICVWVFMVILRLARRTQWSPRPPAEPVQPVLKP
jgi:hypothetical protein